MVEPTQLEETKRPKIWRPTPIRGKTIQTGHCLEDNEMCKFWPASKDNAPKNKLQEIAEIANQELHPHFMQTAEEEEAIDDAKVFKILQKHSDPDEGSSDCASVQSIDINYKSEIFTQAQPEPIQKPIDPQYISVTTTSFPTNMETNIQHSTAVPDDIDVFAEHIGRQLRSLKQHKTRITLQKVIHNLIYTAQIKEINDLHHSKVSKNRRKNHPAKAQNTKTVPKPEAPKLTTNIDVPTSPSVLKAKSKAVIDENIIPIQTRSVRGSANRLSLKRHGKTKTYTQSSKEKFTNPFEDDL